MSGTARCDATVDIAFTGDVVPMRPVPWHDEESLGLREAVAWMRGAHIVMGNMEMPLSTRGHPREKLATFRAQPELAADVGRMGFTCVSLANNHILDYGYEALEDTIGALVEHGVEPLGAGADLAAASAALTWRADDRVVGALAFCCLLPLGAAASEKRPGISPIHVNTAYEIDGAYQAEEPGEPAVLRIRTWPELADVQRATSLVRELRERVDIVLVSIHWGYGADELLAEYQRPLGHALIDAGADVILGHHVHAIHGVEAYRGRLIFYSPGMFVGQQPRRPQSRMSDDGYVGRVASCGGRWTATLMPTVLDRQGLPHLASSDEFTRIADRIARLSRGVDVVPDPSQRSLSITPTPGDAHVPIADEQRGARPQHVGAIAESSDVAP